MLAIIVLLLIYRMYVRSVKLDSKGISSITPVFVPQVTLMTDSNQVAKLVLMSIPTVFRALMPSILSNRLLFMKTSSIKQLGPLTSSPTSLRSPVWLLTLSTHRNSVKLVLLTASPALTQSPVQLVTLHHLPSCTLTIFVTCVIFPTVCLVTLTMYAWVVRVLSWFQKESAWHVYRRVSAMDGFYRR